MINLLELQTFRTKKKKKKNTQPSIWNNQLLFALSFESGAIFEWLDAACQSDKVIPLGWPLMTPTWNIKLLQLFLHGLISDRNEKRPHKCNENEINNIRFDWLSQYRLGKWTYRIIIWSIAKKKLSFHHLAFQFEFEHPLERNQASRWVKMRWQR